MFFGLYLVEIFINCDTLPKIIAKYFVIISFDRNKSDKNARETSFQ